MNETESLVSHERKGSAPKVARVVMYSLLIFCALLIGTALFMPTPDGPHSRQHANESVAAVKLRKINELQTKYSADHPGKGFSCALQPLWFAEPESKDYDPLAFLKSGNTSGYKFALSSCNTDDKGRIVHYQATAVPVWLGATGYRAFCTDDSGHLWYDQRGSVANCLVSRRPIP
jgi:hypothetical protein